MTLLNSSIPIFFWLSLMGFLRGYFLKVVIFFFSFPVGKGHTPHFCSGSHYIGLIFQNNVKSQTQLWSPNFDAFSPHLYPQISLLFLAFSLDSP